MSAKLQIKEGRLKRLSPSGIIRDGLIGTAGFVAIRICWLYFAAFAGHVDLLARMGPNLIFGVLIIALMGLMANRLVEALAESSARNAASNERQASATERMAETQVRHEEDQRELAGSYRSIAESMHTMAADKGRAEQEIDLAINTLIIEVKRNGRRMNGVERAMERIENSLGINRGEAEQESDHDVDG